jgi:hypothetical protein
MQAITSSQSGGDDGNTGFSDSLTKVKQLRFRLNQFGLLQKWVAMAEESTAKITYKNHVTDEQQALILAECSQKEWNNVTKFISAAIMSEDFLSLYDAVDLMHRRGKSVMYVYWVDWLVW